MKLRDVSISRKIIVVLMATAITSLLIAAGILYAFAIREFHGNLRSEMNGVAGVVSSNITAALDFQDARAAQEILDAVTEDTRVLAAGVYDGQGNRFVWLKRDGATADLSTRLESIERSVTGDLEIFHPVSEEGKALGTLYMLVSSKQIYDRLREYSQWLLLVMFLAGSVAYLIGERLTKIISSPIVDLSRAAQDVSERGDYGLQVEKQGNDEIGGLVDHFNAMLRQIQERDRALRETTDWLRLITDSLPVLISYVDAEGRFVFNNAAYMEWFGLTPKELVGKHVMEILDPAGVQALEPHMGKVLSGERVLFEEYVQLKGGARYLLGNLVPDVAPEGSIRGYFALISDVTDRRRAEFALKESEEKFRLALTAASMGTWHRDIDADETIIDENLRNLFGLETNGGAPKSDRFWELAIEEDRDLVRKAIDTAIEGRKELSVEFRIRRPDGSFRWITTRGRTFFNDDGTAKSMAGVCVDITDRKEAENHLRRMNELLEQRVRERTAALEESQDQLRNSERLASLGTLATGIAHEINNPMNSILLASQHALRYSGRLSPEMLTKVLGTIQDEAKRCGLIVKSVLQFSKAERSKKWLHDISSVVRHAIDLSRTYVDLSHVSMSFHDRGELPLVEVNPTEMEQVMVNLIKNAAEAARGPTKLELGVEQSGNWVVLTVRDFGPGIPGEQLRHIFDPFFSTRRQQGGTGLGLSIAHGIIADHGGTMSVASTVGVGTTFTIRLPIPQEGQHGASAYS